jgi:hypothetical protein
MYRPADNNNNNNNDNTHQQLTTPTTPTGSFEILHRNRLLGGLCG